MKVDEVCTKLSMQPVVMLKMLVMITFNFYITPMMLTEQLMDVMVSW